MTRTGEKGGRSRDRRDWLEYLKDLGDRLDERLASGPTRRRDFIERYLKIRTKGGELAPLVANAAQQQFDACAGPRNIVLKARQVGISTWVAARFFVSTITRPGTVSVQVAHDHSSAEAIFRIVHRFLENLPEEMRRSALRTSRANVRQIRFRDLDSEYRVESAADLNAGRGLTIRNLHASEVARWPGEAAETMASLRAAVAPDGEIVLESTPNGAAGCFYDEWQHAAEAGYVRHFFPWWCEPSYRRPGARIGSFTLEERELIERVGLTAEQIAFRRDLRAQFGTLAKQEYAEDAQTCFVASAECVFDPLQIELRLGHCAPPLETHDNGRLLVWWPPNGTGRRPRSHYIIGVDPAGGGVHGDYSCAQLIDGDTGLQCAELHGHLPPRDLARAVRELARRYNHALVAVERNNHGAAVLEYLISAEPYDNLYEQKGQPGWLTTTASRTRMLTHFIVTMEEEPNLFSSERLLRECRTFVRREDGAPAAAAGAHDDCIMAMAIALAVRQEAGRGGVNDVSRSLSAVECGE